MNEFVPEKLLNSVAASDAFFPFPDGIQELIESGIKAIIQPGGSINDKEIIEYCHEHLSSFKKPESIIVTDQLPRNSLGKVLKNVLRDEYSHPI